MSNLTFDPWPERHAETLKAANVTPEQYRLVKRLLEEDYEAKKNDPSSHVARKIFIRNRAALFGLVPLSVGREFWNRSAEDGLWLFLGNCLVRWFLQAFVLYLFAFFYDGWASAHEYKQPESKKEKIWDIIRHALIFLVFAFVSVAALSVVK